MRRILALLAFACAAVAAQPAGLGDLRKESSTRSGVGVDFGDVGTNIL